jgi:hypothetical protein
MVDENPAHLIFDTSLLPSTAMATGLASFLPTFLLVSRALHDNLITKMEHLLHLLVTFDPYTLLQRQKLLRSLEHDQLWRGNLAK